MCVIYLYSYRLRLFTCILSGFEYLVGGKGWWNCVWLSSFEMFIVHHFNFSFHYFYFTHSIYFNSYLFIYSLYPVHSLYDWFYLNILFLCSILSVCICIYVLTNVVHVFFLSPSAFLSLSHSFKRNPALFSTLNGLT